MISNPESELAIIGSLFNDFSYSWSVCTDCDITEDSFTDYKMAIFYSAIIEILNDGGQVDTITVLEFLKRKNLINKVGGIDTIEEILDHTPTSNHIKSYCESVRDCQIRRTVRIAAMKMIEKVESDELDAESILSDSCTSLLQIGTKSEKRTRSQIKAEIIKSVERSKETGCIGLKTPWRYVNETLGGFANGVPVLIAGRRGEGKSTMARNIIKYWSENDIPCGLVLLEDTEDAFWLAQAGHTNDFSSFDSMRGRVDKNKVEYGLDNIMKWPVEIINDPNYTIERIVAWATRLTMTKGIKALIIDNYTQLETNKNFGSDTNAQDRYISNLISKSALRLNIPHIVLCHVTKDNEMKDRELRLADIRGSGTIVDRARQAILLDRKPESIRTSKNEYIANVAKNNNGQTGWCPIYRIDNRQHFTEHNRE